MFGMTNAGEIGESIVLAFIKVTYPAGSVCTCTKDSITLEAEDTSGSYVFYLTEVGTWTISCTNGINTDTATRTVAIGDSVTVALSYWDGHLYNLGNQYTAYTGGWTPNNYNPNSEAALRTNDMLIHSFMAYDASYISNARVITNNKVNLTTFNSLVVQTYEDVANRTEVRIIISNSIYSMASYPTTSDIVYQSIVTSTSSHYTTLDISNVTGSYYVSLFTQRVNGGHIRCYIKEVYLR